MTEFEQEKAKIKEVLKDKPICVEHIGSTSVKGLAAPILDIMAGVQHLDEVDKFIDPLKPLAMNLWHTRSFLKGAFLEKVNGERVHTICISINKEVNSGRINFHSGTI